jgi:hypothetical protein
MKQNLYVGSGSAIKVTDQNPDSKYILKVWWPDATLFYFISFSFIHTIHSHILTFMNIRRGSPPFLHR